MLNTMCIQPIRSRISPVPRPVSPTPAAPSQPHSQPEAQAPSTEKIEPSPPSEAALNAALEDARALQKGAEFNADLIDFNPDGSTTLLDNTGAVENVLPPADERPSPEFEADVVDFLMGAKKAVLTAGAQLSPTATPTLNDVSRSITDMKDRLGELEAKLTDLEHMADMLSTDGLRDKAADIVNLTQQGEAEYARIEAQLTRVVQGMERLSEEKVNQLLAPVRAQLDQVKQELAQANERLQARLPENIRVDLETMTATARLQHDAITLSAELSQSQGSATASVDTETFKAAMHVSSTEGPSGQLEVDTRALKALMDVSADHVNATVEVNTADVKALLEVVDGQVSAEARLELEHFRSRLAANGDGAQLQVDAERLQVLLAAAQGNLSGQAHVNLEQLQASVQASSDGVQAQVEVNREALQLLLSLDSTQQSADVKLQIEALEASLHTRPDQISGRVRVNTEAFEAVLEASTQSFGGRVRVSSDHFEATVAAASDGSISGRVSLSTESLRLMAEVAYKENLSAKLGIATEDLQVDIGTDGSTVNWSVKGQNDLVSVGLTGDHQHLAGTMQIGAAGIEIGLHDVSVDVPEALETRMRQMGGEPVQSEMFGVMVTYRFDAL